ncbi:MAG: TetR/AcrR family transcriptional regulator [Myxococcota bacterium]|nr:TetR/AcrR family transcriptional regulator [Myxococcota bacterium]
MVAPQSELTRRERRKFEVRTRILEASVSLFEQKGIEGTTVVEICELADVAHKTFFNHFQSKHELLREIARDGVQNVLGQIEESLEAGASSAKRIEHFFEGVAEHAKESGPMQRELLSEIVHIGHESGDEPEQARQLHDAFATLVREGRATGDLTQRHSTETLTEMLMGGYYVLMFNWANLDDYPLHERALEMARLLIDSMVKAKGGE